MLLITSSGISILSENTDTLTLDVQVHALLMAPDPAESFAVKPTQVAQPHAADGQHRLAVTTPDFEAPVLTLETQTHTITQINPSSRKVREIQEMRMNCEVYIRLIRQVSPLTSSLWMCVY